MCVDVSGFLAKTNQANRFGYQDSLKNHVLLSVSSSIKFPSCRVALRGRYSASSVVGMFCVIYRQPPPLLGECGELLPSAADSFDYLVNGVCLRRWFPFDSNPNPSDLSLFIAS